MPPEPSSAPCDLIECPPEIRDDAEFWPYLVAIFGDERAAGAIFNANAKPQSTSKVLHGCLDDICAYMKGLMGGLTCEDRYPLCRRCVFSALGRIATAENPASLTNWKMGRQSVLEYINEGLLDECRAAERNGGREHALGLYVPQAVPT